MTETAPRSWLLSCHHCQNMIDVPDPTAGLIYTCGICRTSMEVVDAERGVTRPPPAAATPLAPESPATAASHGQPPAFAPRTFPTPMPVPITPVAMPYDFPLKGYTIIEEVKQDVHGRRLRVQSDSGQKHQALIISADLAAEPEFASRIESQAAIASRMNCPFVINIVRVERIPNGVIYLLNDYGSLETLTHFMKRFRILNERAALNIIKKAAAILEEGQRQGLAHGWLRPDILLLSQRGDVILDELGIPKSPSFLVRKLRYHTARASFYLPPEYLDPQARPDHKSDIFMLGCLLFRMLAGESLLKGASAEEALTKARRDGVRTLSGVRDDLSPGTEAFFLHLTSVDLQERYGQYGEIIERCDRLLAGTKRFTSDQLAKVASNLRRPAGG